MTASSETMTHSAPQARAASRSAVHPFYWSVRRELWENRAVVLGPVIAAAIVLAGVVIAAIHPPQFQQSGPGRHLSQAEIFTLPFDIAAMAIMIIGAVTGVFYSLGALHNERRDRSILFWKSLPVSDTVAVAAKAFIPFAVLPGCVFVVVIVTHLVMLALQTASLGAHGESLAVLGQIPLFKLWLVLAWGIFAFTLWWAPIWGWLFMVSAWARRMTFLWAVAPPIVAGVFEQLAFGSRYIGRVLQDRIGGSTAAAFSVHDGRVGLLQLPHPDPAGFAATPGLWIGLVVAAVFFAAALWLRRRAEPI